MRLIQKAAWLSVVLAMSAAAQEGHVVPTAAYELPPDPPRWSVGAGASWSFPGLGTQSVGLGGGLSTLVSPREVPVASASLEYAVTGRFSLSFGLAADYTERETSASSATGEPLSNEVAYGAALAVGGRWFLSEGTTRVSLHAHGNGGFSQATSDLYLRYLGAYPAARAAGLGASAGFAVDQTLFEVITIRASLDVLSAGVSFHRQLTENFRPVPGSETLTAVNVGVTLSPGFGLRLAF